jgi:hypothetical protein
MFRRAALAAVITLFGCDQGHDQFGPGVDSGVVHFDGAVPNDLELPPLDGNVLPLDGGGPYAHLVFTINDGDTMLPVPARVIFRPPPGAGFADSITMGPYNVMSPGSATGAVVGPGVLGSPEGVMLASGQGVVPVPPGTYSLFITRGPEYEAAETSVTVGAGDVVPVSTTLDRTVDTVGWLAADMHVHVGFSFDSKLPAERRVISMVSNGVEVIVATDHNVFTDLGPVATALGYGGDLVSTVVGDEFNFQEGHGGAYPVVYNGSMPFGGAPPWQNYVNGICQPPVVGINCFTASDAFPMMHGQIPGTTVVTVNHPYWAGGDLGYFTNIAWGAGTANPLPTALSTAGMFDAIEILNGYQTNDTPENNLVADWFYLLGQGFKVTALGSSDTHKINWVRSGWPRTWLRLGTDKPGDASGALVADAIRKNRAVASTGPYVALQVDGGDIGDQVIPKTPGQVTVAVRVDAPNWIDVDTLRIYVNGQLRRTIPIPPGSRPRWNGSFTENITADSWVVAFVTGATPLPPDVVGEYSHYNNYEMKPWAITNPVFVDANGDGQWNPPPSSGGFPKLHHTPAPFDRTVPEGCDPSERIGTEAPLATPEHIVMPLLY